MKAWRPLLGPRPHNQSSYLPDHHRARTVTRCLSVLRVLADGRLHSRESLARKFGVSGRTIRRDVHAIVAAGFWIEVDYLPPMNEQAYQLVRARHADFIRVLQ